jgi:catechol-2,3-dioxygenase
MDEIWIDHAIKADVLIEYKKVGSLEIIYLKDPSGNYVEVVREC